MARNLFFPLSVNTIMVSELKETQTISRLVGTFYQAEENPIPNEIQSSPCGRMVYVFDCHTEDPGSIPGRGGF